MNSQQDPAGSRLAPTTGSLLPCPFCGEQPKYEPQAESLIHPNNYWPHQIVHYCKAIGQQICVRANIGRANTPERVFAMWNTRAHTENAPAYRESDRAGG